MRLWRCIKKVSRAVLAGHEQNLSHLEKESCSKSAHETQTMSSVLSWPGPNKQLTKIWIRQTFQINTTGRSVTTGLQLSRLDLKIKYNLQDKPLSAPLPDRHTSAPFLGMCFSACCDTHAAGADLLPTEKRTRLLWHLLILNVI